MKNVRLSWLKLPASQRLVGVDVATFALAPDALRDEHGVFVSISDLAVADRAAVFARYEAERQAVAEMLDQRCNWTPGGAA